MESDLQFWCEKGFEIKWRDEPTFCTTNLRIADDVLLLSTSMNHLKKNVGRLEEEHMKSRAANSPGKDENSYKPKNEQTQKDCDRRKVEVLPASGKAKYLGEIITFEQQELADIKKFDAFWSAFAKHSQDLTSRSYLLRHKTTTLVDSVIAPVMMHGAGTLTTTNEHENMIRTAQRKILRLIIQMMSKHKGKKAITTTSKDGIRSTTEHDTESDEGDSISVGRDQDSNISF